MNKRPFPSFIAALHWGALEIAGIYLVLGAAWILFSDQAAARVALNEEMLATISLYKGWGYVLVTALLLYWMIRRHIVALRASELQLHGVLDAMPVFISYVGADRRYQFTNKTYQEWYGENMEGKHIEEVLGKAAYRAVSKYIDKVLTGEAVSYEAEIPFRGMEVSMAVKYIPDSAADGQVKGYFVLAQDMTEHKQAQADLRQWADAFEGCAHGIAIGDPNTNRIVVCNPAFARMHKSRVEDIVGTAILNLYAPSDHEHVRQNVQKADQIGHARFEVRMTRKDGSTFPVEMDVVSVLGDDGELLHRVATAQDISNRKSIDEKLKESETKYRTLVEHLSAITYISEPDQSVGVSYISPQIKSLGFNADAWVADPELWFRHIHPDDQEQVAKELHQFQDGAETFRAEYRLILPNGETRWFHDESVRVKNEGGKTILKQGFMLDITDRKRAEEQLRKSEERYHYLFENNPHPMWIYDRKTLAFLDVNEAAIVKYGYAREEFLTMTIEDIRPPEDIEKLMNNLAQPRQPLERSEGWRHRLKDGTIIHVEITSHTIVIDGHESALVVAQDVTERMQAEENLRRFQLLSEHSRDIILFMGYKDGHILNANSGAVQAYGYSRDELLSLTIRDLRASDALPLTADQMAEAEAGGILFETIHQRKDGTTFPVEVSSQGATTGGVRTLISIVRDITERKRSEAQLERSNLKLNEILTSIQDDFYVLDRDWGFVYASRQFTSKVGKEPEDFIGQNIWKMFPNHVGTLLEENFRAAMEKREIRRFEIGGKYSAAWYRMTAFPSTEGITVLGADITERKRAEEALRLKDDLLHLTSEMAKVGGWEFDAETGKGTWTDEVARIHDLDPALETDVEIGLSFYQRESRQKIEQAVQEAIELAKPYDLELEMVTAKGNHKWVRTAALPIIQDGKVIKVQGIFQDITERKIATETLRQSEERFASVFHSSPTPIALTRLADGKIMDVNEAFCQLFEYSFEEIVGHTSLELGISDPESRRKAVETLKEKGLILNLEQKARNHSGAQLSILNSIETISINGEAYALTTIIDITERKEIEKALQTAHDELELKVQERTAALSEANALLQALMDNMPDHIYFKDTQSRFIRNSRSQANLLGLKDPAEAVGKSDFDFFPHAAKSYAEEQEVMRSGTPLVDLEEWVVWPDGREMWVTTTKMPLRNSKGQTIGIFGISHDITERKRTEQAIRQLNSDLEKQAEQLQASNKELEAFSYSVSHDLRAPLRAIDGYTRILVEDYESILDSEGKRICGVISREARRMGQLIDDLLSFSRLGRKEMYTSRIDMKALAVSVFDELIKEENRERFDFEIAKLPPAKGDSSLMRQVWVNLLANAIKFTSKKERSVIEVGSKQTPDEKIYYVRDNGAGFDMEYGNKLFGVFQRLHTESEFSGTGVGLAIVQRIVRRHGGHVWAQGAVEKGATFYFALPRKENLR